MFISFINTLLTASNNNQYPFFLNDTVPEDSDDVFDFNTGSNPNEGMYTPNYALNDLPVSFDSLNQSSCLPMENSIPLNNVQIQESSAFLAPPQASSSNVCSNYLLNKKEQTKMDKQIAQLKSFNRRIQANLNKDKKNS